MRSILTAAFLVLIGSASWANAALMARIEVFPTDLEGNPISTIAPGEDFLINAMVQDIRDPASAREGVFGAYFSLTFDPQLAYLPADEPPTFGPMFANGKAYGQHLTPGLVKGIGAFVSTFTAPGPEPQLLVQIPATAMRAGEADFAPLFDTTAGNDVALFGLDNAIPKADIEFVGSSLNIVPEPSTYVLALIAMGTFAACFCRQHRAAAVLTLAPAQARLAREGERA